MQPHSATDSDPTAMPEPGEVKPVIVPKAPEATDKAPEPATPTTMDYQQGFTSGPST